MASDKQIAANQHNAQFSTGPRDTSRTSQNASKHGLTAEAITPLDWAEHEFFCNILREHFRPVGPIEMVLVDRIALQVTRLQRAAALESIHVAHKAQMRKASPDLQLEIAAMKASLLGEEPPRRYLLTAEDIGQINESVGRYETAIENRFYRALHELERLQRRRQGEHVPAPAAGDLNVHGTDSTTLAPGNAAYVKPIRGEEL